MSTIRFVEEEPIIAGYGIRYPMAIIYTGDAEPIRYVRGRIWHIPDRPSNRQRSRGIRYMHRRRVRREHLRRLRLIGR